MTAEEQRIFILVDNIKNNCYEVAEKLLEDFKEEVRVDTIDECIKSIEDSKSLFDNSTHWTISEKDKLQNRLRHQPFHFL